MKTVRFDESLPILVDIIRLELGKTALQTGTVLRDVIGCLSFFAAEPLAEEAIANLSKKLRTGLGAYARSDRCVAGPDDYGSATVREDPSALVVRVGGDNVRLVDKRLAGADWLRAPSPPKIHPPRLVFASLKGGVGRSTALAVVAAHLASRGQRVLAIDLDMEAPGLGTLLLTPDKEVPAKEGSTILPGTLPEFGVIDALVENGVSGLDEGFYADLVGPSELADKGGVIHVIPALGRRSLNNPGEVLAKIARAYTEDIQPDGSVATILDQVTALVDHFADPTRYDAILIDARAGLHETTASAVLGLGAEVLLFGLDEPQTFQGYAVMLAHLARFVPPTVPGIEAPEWVRRLTMVQGKAPADADERDEFAQRCRQLFVKAGLSPAPPAAEVEVPLPAGSFKNVPWDDDIPDEEALPTEWSLREPLAVLYDAQFQRFDPLRRRDLLSDRIYRATFGDLLDRVDDILRFSE